MFLLYFWDNQLCRRKTHVSSGQEDLSRPSLLLTNWRDQQSLPNTWPMCWVIISIPNSRSADYFQQLVDDQRAKIALLQVSVASLEEELDACQNDLKLCWIFSSGLRQEPTVETFDHVKQLLGTPPLSMDYTGRKAGEHAEKKPQYTQRRLSPDDELLLTLVKLRHDFPKSDLAVCFAVSQSTVSRAFSRWVLCLYHSFKEINIWQSRLLVNEYIPIGFAKKYPSTHVVIDAPEFRTEKPANPDVQAATWSNYKYTNTFKLLVGVSPNGVTTFLSPLWGGRISDK